MQVQSVFDVVRAACGGVEPKWYLGSGGHRNPWALIKAAALKQVRETAGGGGGGSSE